MNETRKEKLQMEKYLESRGEVRELERLLLESRQRYRKQAKNVKRQTWGDWVREWKEWWDDKEGWISKRIQENEEELTYFSQVKHLFTGDKNSVFQDGYDIYNKGLNDPYGDMETDEI